MNTTTAQTLRNINAAHGATVGRLQIEDQVTELRNEFIRRTAASIIRRAARLMQAAKHLAMECASATITKAVALCDQATAEFKRAKALLVRTGLDADAAHAQAAELMLAAR